MNGNTILEPAEIKKKIAEKLVGILAQRIW